MSDERDLVRSRIDLVDLVGQRVRLKKSGKNLTGLCPFHEDRNPSFSVSPDIGRYKCWSCGASGDAFTWVMETQGLTFREALELLAKQAGVELGRGGVKQDKTKRQAMADAMEAALRFFRDQLQLSSKAREYCEGRALDQGVLETWEVGYAPNVGDLLAHELKKKGFVLSDCKDLSLVDGSEQTGYGDRFRGRLMFPIRDELGHVVGFGGRVIGDGQPKYINSSDSPLFNKSKTLYGAHRAKDSIRRLKQAVVVEGYLDVIACHRAGVENAVATLGTSLSEQHVKKLALWCDEVVLLYDSDEAGQKAAERAVNMFMSEPTKVKVALMAQGDDPDTLLRSKGPDAVKQAASSGINPVDFIVQRIGQRSSPENEDYWIEVTQVLSRLTNALELERYIMPLAMSYPFMRDPDRAAKALRGMVRKSRIPQDKAVQSDQQARKAVVVSIPSGLEAAPFRGLLDAQTRRRAWDVCIETELFITEPARRLSRALRGISDRVGEDASIDQIVDSIEHEADRDALVAVLMKEDATWDIAEVLARLKKRREEIHVKSTYVASCQSDVELRSLSDRLKRLKGVALAPEKESADEFDPYA